MLTNPCTHVLSVAHHRLPMSTWRDRRGFAIARVAPFGRAPVSVASVHLSLEAVERAWQLIGRTMRPVSLLQPTFPSAAPDRVLDVVFAIEDVAALPHREVPWVWEDLQAGSDHRPVWVDVDLPQTRAP